MKEIKNWVVAYDSGEDKDLSKHITAETREEAEKEFARQLKMWGVLEVSNVEMWEDNVMGWRSAFSRLITWNSDTI